MHVNRPQSPGNDDLSDWGIVVLAPQESSHWDLPWCLLDPSWHPVAARGVRPNRCISTRWGFHTEYVGWAVTAGIPVKFCNAHGRSTPVVGSGFPIEAYGRIGVSRPSTVIGNSNQNISAITDLLSPKQNFFSLTVCRLAKILFCSHRLPCKA